MNRDGVRMKAFEKDGRVGILREIVVETPGYRWKAVLALVDINGDRILYGVDWRINAWAKAERELAEFGWTPTNFPRGAI